MAEIETTKTTLYAPPPSPYSPTAFGLNFENLNPLSRLFGARPAVHPFGPGNERYNPAFYPYYYGRPYFAGGYPYSDHLIYRTVLHPPAYYYGPQSSVPPLWARNQNYFRSSTALASGTARPEGFVARPTPNAPATSPTAPNPPPVEAKPLPPLSSANQPAAAATGKPTSLVPKGWDKVKCRFPNETPNEKIADRLVAEDNENLLRKLGRLPRHKLKAYKPERTPTGIRAEDLNEAELRYLKGGQACARGGSEAKPKASPAAKAKTGRMPGPRAGGTA